MTRPPVKLILFFAAVMVAWFGGSAEAQEAIPELVQDTGMDSVGWLVDTFGYPGIAIWIAWQLRGYLASLKEWQGMPIVVRLHPDTQAQFVPRDPAARTRRDDSRRAEQRHDSTPTESDEPQPRGRR